MFNRVVMDVIDASLAVLIAIERFVSTVTDHALIIPDKNLFPGSGNPGYITIVILLQSFDCALIFSLLPIPIGWGFAEENIV